VTTVTKRLVCEHCRRQADTPWEVDPADRLLRPLDLLPYFYERVRRNNNRSGTELACLQCGRTVPWPR
jgi:RNase P subunit RPR2